MKAKYLNYSQAWAVCNEYQALRGHSENDNPPVEAVLLAPYSRILQWHYVRSLLKGQLPAALLDGYPGNRYDVIVLTRSAAAPGEYAIQSLRDYLSDHDFPFDLRRYSGQRMA